MQNNQIKLPEYLFVPEFAFQLLMTILKMIFFLISMELNETKLYISLSLLNCKLDVKFKAVQVLLNFFD